MNREALQRLVEVMDAVTQSKRRFNIDEVINHNYPCGTVACAFGWFALIGQWPNLIVCPSGSIIYERPNQLTLTGFSNPLRAVFDLQETTHRCLFLYDPDYFDVEDETKVTAAFIAERVQRLLQLNDENAFIGEMRTRTLRHINEA